MGVWFSAVFAVSFLLEGGIYLASGHVRFTDVFFRAEKGSDGVPWESMSAFFIGALQ